MKMPTSAFENAKSKLGARTEICGNRSVTVDGCSGIIEYSDETVSVKAGKIKITITGKNLIIVIFTEDCVVVEGFILNVGYSYGR